MAIKTRVNKRELLHSKIERLERTIERLHERNADITAGLTERRLLQILLSARKPTRSRSHHFAVVRGARVFSSRL